MEVSGLSFIANPPEQPMQLFQEWHTEVQQNDPTRFNDVMTIASIDDIDGLLNRNVALRKFDENGFSFVTERSSKKYKNFMKNPSVAAVFLWMYMINGTYITRQIRVTGTVSELSEPEIVEFYKEEPLMAKIRSKICRIGEEINWNELKATHDQVLKDYQEGRDTLPQSDSYTALRITPLKFDFYYARKDEIADRVKYTRNDGNWVKCHIAT